MCIISVSAAGVRQPTEAELRTMFTNNPHGAGYMTVRDGKVRISKGFMSWPELFGALRREAFTPDDPVVYHFRISTQAGVNPGMTHPFPLSADITQMTGIELSCACGVAHNGIIRLTSDWRDRKYSDTAHYIAEFMAYIVRNLDDLKNPAVLDAIRRTTDGSRWAIMDKSGYIATVGDFTEKDGLLFSNTSYMRRDPVRNAAPKHQRVLRGFYDDAEEYDDDDRPPFRL